MPVNSTAAELVAPVIALEDQGRIPRALRLVDSLLATHGRSAELLAARARLLGAQGRLVDAQETADLAADLWPDSAAAHQARGDVLADADLNVAALAAADRALTLGGPAVGALVVRSIALNGLDRTAEAVSTARFAVQLAPNDPVAVGAAVRDLDRVLDRQPNSVHALAIRALAHLLSGQHQHALDDADAAVRAGDSTDSVAYTARMLALLALRRRAEAEATARQILQHHPEHHIARQIQDAKDTRWQQNIDAILTLAKTALGLGFL